MTIASRPDDSELSGLEVHSWTSTAKQHNRVVVVIFLWKQKQQHKMIGGILLQVISRSCFWTKIFQRDDDTLQVFMTIWGCEIKHWAVLFKIDDRTYHFRTSVLKNVSNFENNTDIYINTVAENVYTVNLRSSKSLIKPTSNNKYLPFTNDRVNNLDKLFLCPVLSSKNINLEPVLNKDYCVYTKVDVPTSGILVVEYLKHQHAIININKYTCPQDCNRFKAVIYNLFTGRFKVEIVKAKHKSVNCFYCNIICKIQPPSSTTTSFIFSPRYTQAILNF